MALTYDDFLGLDVGGLDVLTELQGSIRTALAEGEDPGPALAFAVLSLVVDLSDARAQKSDLKAYVLDLETRLLNAGLRFAPPQG